MRRLPVLLFCCGLWAALPVGVLAADWQTLNTEARSYFATGQYDKAAEKTREALAKAEEKLGPDHNEVQGMLSNLARIYRTLNQPAEAEPVLKRVALAQEKKARRQSSASGCYADELGASAARFAAIWRG